MSQKLHVYLLCWPSIKIPHDSKTSLDKLPVADPETSERGGQETWNISCRARWPSFFGLFLQARGGGAWPPCSPPPWIRYWLPIFLFKFVKGHLFNSLLLTDHWVAAHPPNNSNIGVRPPRVWRLLSFFLCFSILDLLHWAKKFLYAIGPNHEPKYLYIVTQLNTIGDRDIAWLFSTSDRTFYQMCYCCRKLDFQGNLWGRVRPCEAVLLSLAPIDLGLSDTDL